MFLCGSDGKESTSQCRRLGFNIWMEKIPWRRKWQPTLVFLPGESHGGRSLVGYSPWGREESETTEWLHCHFHFLLPKSHEVCLNWQNSSRKTARIILFYLTQPQELGFSVDHCAHLSPYSMTDFSLQSHGLCSLPGSLVHEILQGRILEWVATSFFRGSS